MGAMDLQLESANVQHGQAKLNVEAHAQDTLLSDGNYMEEKINDSNADYEMLEKGVMQYGIQSKLIQGRDMNFHAIKYNRLYVHYVALNKRFSKYASIVVYAWGSTSVKCASSLMMICLCSKCVTEQFFHMLMLPIYGYLSEKKANALPHANTAILIVGTNLMGNMHCRLIPSIFVSILR